MSISTLRKIVLGILDTAVRIAILVFVCSMVKKVCITSYDYGYRVFSETPITMGEGMEKEVVIPIGSSSRDIGTILKNNGLIRDEKLFFVQELLSSYRGKLQPGTYTLNTSMTAEDMMKIMAGEAEEEEEEDDTAAPAEGSSDVTADAMSESGAVDLDVSGIDTGEEGQTEEGENAETEGAGENTENAQ